MHDDLDFGLGSRALAVAIVWLVLMLIALAAWLIRLIASGTLA